jgi:hypothetical protein
MHYVISYKNEIESNQWYMKCLFPFDCHFSLKFREDRLTTNGSGVQSENPNLTLVDTYNVQIKVLIKNLNKY